MTAIKLVKRFLLEYKLSVLLILTLSVLWRLGFLHSIENDWKQFSFEHNDGAIEAPEKRWEKSPLWVEDQKPHINPHKYRYLINEPEYCQKPNVQDHGKDQAEAVDLLILVSSAVSHSERREAIRATWGSADNLKTYNSKLLFLLGQGMDQQGAVVEESQRRRDIIQEDFHDIYYNLIIKTVMGLKWSAIFCQQAKYVMKTDDDIFINIPFLHSAVKKSHEQFSTHISGCIKNGAKTAPQPIPATGQGNVPHSIMVNAGHPEFTAGAGYLIPGSFVTNLYLAALSTRFIPVEDAFTTGYAAKKIGLHPPHHDWRFSCGQMVSRKNECAMAKMFTGHKVDPDLQYLIWETLQRQDYCK